jgi:hypothetical protein
MVPWETRTHLETDRTIKVTELHYKVILNSSLVKVCEHLKCTDSVLYTVHRFTFQSLLTSCRVDREMPLLCFTALCAWFHPQPPYPQKHLGFSLSEVPGISVTLHDHVQS